ncbi:MAG: response regulator [Lachnospiraceae bacterium]|nr:response regulator [Lachnospiraceae bacterium]
MEGKKPAKNYFGREVIEGIRNKATRFLMVSLLSVSVLCVIVFIYLAVHMNYKSSETIGKIGKIYMSGMSEQVAMHFETAIELRLSQLNELVGNLQSGITDEEELRQRLAKEAQIRGFEYLAFYSGDGDFDMIYGEKIRLMDPPPFLHSLDQGEKKVAIGKDESDADIVLMGVPVDSRLPDGRECKALVAALPIHYIKETLFLNDSSSMEYYFIIRRDGSFILRRNDVEDESYFDRVLNRYGDVGGLTPEEYLTELGISMDAQRDFSSEFIIEGERRHLYCTSLSYSEWFLLVFMPYGILDETIAELGGEWLVRALGGCAVILLALMIVFFKYFRQMRKQMLALDEARQMAEHASKAKSEFLSNMSHDIRTPMNAIVGMTSIAIANIKNQQQVLNNLKKISLSSRHLLGLINNILDMSKIESGKLSLNVEQISLSEIMDGIVSIIQPQIKEKSQHFEVHVDNVFVENICCDSVRLNQVLINFLGNAVKFTPEGGTIRLSLCEELSPRGDAYVRIHLRVRDNGIGMSKEFQKKLFDSFSREDSTRVQKTEGSGLGMAITKYIIDAMAGTIEVKSEPGKGTEFHVTLDLERSTVPENDMRLPEWDMLIVDDDQQLYESAATALQASGVRTEWTMDGESALLAVEERMRQNRPYHIILMDWKLPGMDGIRTARKLRELCGDELPILLISAYDWSEIEEEARAAGISGFIAKPLFKSTLYYSLRQFAGDFKAQEWGTPEGEFDFSGRRILLAEDNDLNWEIAQELLSEIGLELDWAENGQICVEKFERSPVGTYDGILMDIRMPVMTGYEATKAIRKLDRPDAGTIPIIAMSADAFSEDIQKCLACGMNGHIAKPIDMREVTRMLERFIVDRREPLESHF